jgi:hypothetical protein
VQSATRLGRFPLRHLSRQVGAKLQVFACFLAQHDGANHRAPRRNFGGFCDGARGCILRATSARPPRLWDCCRARRAAAHASAGVPNSVEGSAYGAVCGQRVATPPPSSTTSPGAMKQWRDDVDRLLGMAHSTSTRSRPLSSRRQREATASVRSPSVRGAQTDNLRAELNRRRTGEDAWVSLERARERRENIEGRNLDRDFAAEAPQTPVGARSQTGVPLAGVGCAALADHLRTASWPPKFRPHLPEKYDGTTNPSEFLQIYVTAITATGGNTAVMATYFHVALSGPARTWLMNLAPGSIYSWEELCARFVANFASAYQQHGVEAHLHAVRQEPGETLRKFISRFTKVRGTIPHISDASIITTFRQGVRDKKMLEKLATHDVETVPMLFTLADKCARAAEGRAWHSAHDHKGVTAARALYIPTVATTPWSVARSLISQNASANAPTSDVSSLPETAPHLAAVLAKKRSTTARWLRLNRTSGISHPRGT